MSINFNWFQATCVYSSAKYPASDYSPSQTTFSFEETMNFQKILHPKEGDDEVGYFALE